MKKYLFGLSAIFLAITFSAFTNPAKIFTAERFRFVALTTVQSQVENPALWVYTPSYNASCTSSIFNDQACEILVDEKFYHLDEYDDYVLNICDPDDDGNDEKMVIAAAVGENMNGYIVVSFNGIKMTSSGTVIFNNEIP